MSKRLIFVQNDLHFVVFFIRFKVSLSENSQQNGDADQTPGYF